MFRKLLMSAAAAAAIASTVATASAQVVDPTAIPVEIEGPLKSYTVINANSGELTVMNNTIRVTSTGTEFVTPTGSRSDLVARGESNESGKPYNVSNWMRGERFDGRAQAGLIGATVIVTGTINAQTGIITATEVFSDVAENVILGAIWENQCTTSRCDGFGDYIRGNGPTGPAFVRNADKRLPALPVTDAGLFELNLAGKSLVGTPDAPTTFGGEGYFAQNGLQVGTNPDAAGVVYWAFELGENRPDLLLNPTTPEISSLRIRCTEGGRLEVRGFVHAPVNADGTPLGGNFATNILNPTSGGQGRIRVVMNVDGVPTTFLDEDGAPPVADLPGTYGVYRLRQDVAQCGTEATVFWDRANTINSPWASTLAPVDRLREE